MKRYSEQHDEPENLYYKAYRGYEQECAYDEDSTLDMLRTAGGFADPFRPQSRYQAAENSYREAWERYKRWLRQSHPKAIAMLTNLAILCRNQERYKEANNLGPGHP